MYECTNCESVFYVLNPRQAYGTFFVEFIPSELQPGPVRRLIERDLRRLVLHVGESPICFDLSNLPRCDGRFLDSLVDACVAIEAVGGEVTIDGVRLLLEPCLLPRLAERGATSVEVRTEKAVAYF